jgi:hypothetical protein
MQVPVGSNAAAESLVVHMVFIENLVFVETNYVKLQCAAMCLV